jgi:hypothetical protein
MTKKKTTSGEQLPDDSSQISNTPSSTNPPDVRQGGQSRTASTGAIRTGRVADIKLPYITNNVQFGDFIKELDDVDHKLKCFAVAVTGMSLLAAVTSRILRLSL